MWEAAEVAAACTKYPPSPHLPPLGCTPPRQTSEWIDKSVQERFAPYSACAAGHVAGALRVCVCTPRCFACVPA